jgi:hypothetical protein
MRPSVLARLKLPSGGVIRFSDDLSVIRRVGRSLHPGAPGRTSGNPQQDRVTQVNITARTVETQGIAISACGGPRSSVNGPSYAMARSIGYCCPAPLVKIVSCYRTSRGSWCRGWSWSRRGSRCSRRSGGRCRCGRRCCGRGRCSRGCGGRCRCGRRCSGRCWCRGWCGCRSRSGCYRSIHVALDLSGAQCPVINPHIINPARKILSIERIASNRKRRGSNLNRTTCGLACHLGAVHVQTQCRSVICRCQIRPGICR